MWERVIIKMITLMVDNIGFGIEKLPDRKNPSLVIINGDELCVGTEIVGSFSSDEAAEKSQRVLRIMFNNQ